ncbi:hypothetical protein H311_01287 [Anncaliia algerae PRA109]|nr:hypothetical protein H311_01287 [Anncaliia algerae PRA109]
MINLRPRNIEGIGHMVEIDESKFSKRKYNIDRNIRSPRVVGGLNILTEDFFY